MGSLAGQTHDGSETTDHSNPSQFSAKKLHLRKPFLPSPKGLSGAELGAAVPPDLRGPHPSQKRDISVGPWEPEPSGCTFRSQRWAQAARGGWGCAGQTEKVSQGGW